jgi:predicted PurR-regulated permease PerM
MEIIYFTVAALLLYWFADYILNTIEIKLEKRLPNRSLIFFVIIAILAVVSFGIIEILYKGEDKEQTTKNTQVQPVTTSHTTQQDPPSQAQPD